MEDMRIVQAGRPKPLMPAFTRKLRRTIFVHVLFAVAVFGLTARWLLHTHTKHYIDEQARACAAALVPGPNGNLSEAVEGLLGRYDRLVAVATLDASGNLHTVYPQRSAHRRAALAVLANQSDPVAMSAPKDGEPIKVSGVVVPLNGSPSPAARRVLILLRNDEYRIGWVRATAMFALLVGAAGFQVVWSMRRWFDGRVASRLRSMARAIYDPLNGVKEVSTLEPGEWRETAEIAKGFHALFQGMAESDARARRVKRETERKLRQREVGFDRALRRVRDQATMDALTKLRNRTFLEEELEPLFDRQREKPADLATIMIDVDNFKQYNDTHGHQVGDALLRFLGALLRGAGRPTDHAIRYGGDEFLLLLPDTDGDQATAVAQRRVKLFGRYAGRLGGSPGISISAGVASLNRDGARSGHDLVAKADAALYAAKRQGKNRVAVYTVDGAPLIRA